MGATLVLLEGKAIRSGLSNELDYTPTDRAEHLRRVAHVSSILNDQGIITICSFISPEEAIRAQVEEIIGKRRFNLVYMDADLEFCRKNDKYGLYQKAEEGKLKYLPGIDMEYEVPDNATLTIKADSDDDNVGLIISYLEKRKIYPIE
ncbi:MAG: adenylyl-sulfate kinase [Bacteroidales bacterium]|nr:adenylyl-sulfate kinase [Bacteroidales bacterium]